MYSSKLRDETLKLLRARNRQQTFSAIAVNTKLPIRWIAEFSQGKTDDPGVCKVETLYRYLAGKELAL
jgi:hypothetical protein